LDNFFATVIACHKR